MFYRQLHPSQFVSLTKTVLEFFLKYPTYPALGYSANFGFAAFVVLVMQIITGFFLSLHYIAYAEISFNLLEHIMRDVNYGWLLRYLHANGASFFFFIVFIHMSRGLYYQSYLGYRRDTWIVGVIIFFLLIATAFTGYVLPWGQMSFWAATVVTNLFTAVPLAGRLLVEWLWGGFSVNSFTLVRIFSLHFILPFVILFLSVLHIFFLHYYGGGNRLELHIVADKLRFAPYYLVKDVYFSFWLFFLFFAFVGFVPNLLLHPDNYLQADPLLTPPHIVPEWYFLIFYAMLRSIPSKMGGVVVLFCSILILFILPFLSLWKFKPRFDAKFVIRRPKLQLMSPKEFIYNFKKFRSFFKNLKFIFKCIPFYLSLLRTNKNKLLFWLFFGVCIVLGYIGSQPVEYPYVIFGRVFTMLYFLYFLVLFIVAYSVRSSDVNGSEWIFLNIVSPYRIYITYENILEPYFADVDIEEEGIIKYSQLIWKYERLECYRTH